jgi:hypothetical protein
MSVSPDGLTYISGSCGSNGKQWLEARITQMGSQPYLLTPLQ